MRSAFIFSLICTYCYGRVQVSSGHYQPKDTLILVPAQIQKGFQHDYLLFIPTGTILDDRTTLLVEPNNTGTVSDDIDVHLKAAIRLASMRSVGHDVAKALKIPLLVPVFPRPESQPLIYTHALDRDVQLITTGSLERLDLQLIQMVADARKKLSEMRIYTEPKFFLNGFSASASFTNRFSFIHPELVKALAIGGFNGELMLPTKKIEKTKLNYPLGVNDFSKMYGKNFNHKAFSAIPQFIYMGAEDDNDAVLYDDAYDENERRTIVELIGDPVQPRFAQCIKIYQENQVNAMYKTYQNIGHWTTNEMNEEVIHFFFQFLKKQL